MIYLTLNNIKTALGIDTLDVENITSSVFTVTKHQLRDNDIISFVNNYEDIVAGDTYYVTSTTEDTFKLSLTKNGSTISFTNTSSVLKFSSAKFDTLLTDIEKGVSSFIDSFLGRKILNNATRKEYVKTDENGFAFLSHYPFKTVSIFKQVINSVQTDYTDYTIDKKGGVQAGVKGEYYIEYTAGYDVLPSDIQNIAILLVCKQFFDLPLAKSNFENKEIKDVDLTALKRYRKLA